MPVAAPNIDQLSKQHSTTSGSLSASKPGTAVLAVTGMSLVMVCKW
jgi:hypothetical protein